MPEFVELSPIAHESLSVVLLAANDGDHLEKVVAEWVTYLNGLDREYEILLVVRGSMDSTAQRAAALPDRFRRVQVLHHDAREGEGAALRTGLAAARFPLVCYVRCDPRYQPAELRKMLTQIDKVHLVSGYRAGHPTPLFWSICATVRRLASRVVLNYTSERLLGWLGWRRHAGALLARLVFSIRNEDVGCPYRLLRREILPRMPLQSNGSFVHVEMLAKATFLGRYLGEDVPLGDRQRPFPFAPEDEAGGVFADAWRLFQRPSFGPPRLPETASAASPV